MITITRRDARLLRRVFRRRCLGLARSGPVAPLIFRVDPDAGLRVRHHQGELAVERLLPGSRRPVETAALPLEVLKTLRADEDSPVVIEAESPTATRVAWLDGSYTETARFAVPRLRALRPFPAPPSSWSELAVGLLDDLAAASAYAPRGVLRLRDDATSVAGTEDFGSRLPRGQRFPWEGSLLIYAAPVFARPDLPRSAPLLVGRTATHLAIRAGTWTLWMALRSEAEVVPEAGGPPVPVAAPA